MCCKNVSCNRCSIVFLVFSPCSVAGQPRVLSSPSPFHFNFYRKKFPLVSFLFVCFRHRTLSCKCWQYSKQSQQSGKACCVHMLCNIVCTTETLQIKGTALSLFMVILAQWYKLVIPRPLRGLVVIHYLGFALVVYHH